MKGVLWEPVPVQGTHEIRSRVWPPGESDPVAGDIHAQKREVEIRREKILRTHMVKYGPSKDCLGCSCFMNKKKGYREHTNECKQRSEKLWEHQ